MTSAVTWSLAQLPSTPTTLLFRDTVWILHTKLVPACALLEPFEAGRCGYWS